MKMKEKGREPQALRDRPDIPWYYEVYIHHFKRLSFSRSYHMGGPNPIDIRSILDYNEKVVKMDYVDFLDIMQVLDSCYLKYLAKKGGEKEVKDGTDDRR